VGERPSKVYLHCFLPGPETDTLFYSTD